MAGTLEGKEVNDGNVVRSVKNPYLKTSQWGWAIDPLGLRTGAYCLQWRPGAKVWPVYLANGKVFM